MTPPAVLDPASVPMGGDRGRGWAAIRDAGPVVRLLGQTLLTRQAHVLDALRRPELFSNRAAFDAMGCPLPLVPISFDPPEHTRYRRLLQPYFSPRALAAMRPALQRQADELVDGLVSRGRCDAVADLAVPYPSQVFLTMFGLPLADRDMLIAWKDGVLDLMSRSDRDGVVPTPAVELFGYANHAVAVRRANPGADLLSQLLTADQPLSDEEAVSMCFLFVIAGLDTVTSALSAAMWKLAVRPDLRRRLCAEPERVGEFIEEILRLEGPVPAVPRVATADVTVGGVHLPAGCLVNLAIGAANREPAGELDDVRLDGTTRSHWAFGSGPHRCLGSHLARMEMRLLLTAWLSRIPDFELAPGAAPAISYPASTFSFPSVPLVYPAELVMITGLCRPARAQRESDHEHRPPSSGGTELTTLCDAAGRSAAVQAPTVAAEPAGSPLRTAPPTTGRANRWEWILASALLLLAFLIVLEFGLLYVSLLSRVQ